jgi:hypothetical protein
MRRFGTTLATLAAFYAASPSASALLLDGNNNQMSDLWEMACYDGELFPPSFLPNDDPDGDGWTNLEESIAGTDPFVNDSHGPLRLSLKPVAAPATFRAVWPTTTGKAYQLQCSETMDPGSWLPVEDQILGDGEDADLIVPTETQGGGPPPKLFWRVSITDVDLDGDRLTNYDEYLLGSDPESADSDEDGVDDATEYLEGTIVSSPRPTDPPIVNGLESRWIDQTTQEVVYFNGQMISLFTMFIPDSNEGATWSPAQPEYGDLIAAANFAALSAEAATFPLPGAWEQKYTGLWWMNEREDSYLAPQGIRAYRAGRLSHRLTLNKKAPPGGYEYPLQVVKLHWMRDPAPLSPWVPDTGGTNSSIINKAVVPAGQLISQEITYDPIPALAENRAITLHAIRFEETGPDSGFDNLVRYLPDQRFELPWLMVANSTTPATPPNAQVKLHFSPASPQLHLDVVVDGARTATVSPNVVGGNQPVTLTIAMDGPWVGGINEQPIEGRLRIEGVDVLNLVFYPRQTTSVAVHAITLVNDDVETKHWYRDPLTLQQKEKVIAVDEGKPDTICIKKKSGTIWSTPKGDDWENPGGICTGPNGICDTKADSRDEKVIDPGFGEKDAQIIGPGPNQLLNTAPNAYLANSKDTKGNNVYPQDDAANGTAIHTGPDGIRQTRVPVARQEPQNLPTQAQLQQHLDRIYGRQANIWFTITQWDAADVAFDVASTSGVDANYPALALPNYRFDFYSSEMAGDAYVLTQEEQLVQTALKDPAATFNLYYIAAPLGMRYRILGNPLVSSPHGYARRPLRTPYISTYALAPLKHLSTPQLLHAAAHEMGHSAVLKNQVATNNKFGLAHPWEESNNKLVPNKPEENFTSLDMSSDLMRLMWGTLPTKDAMVLPGKFNKHEADKLHLGKQ